MLKKIVVALILLFVTNVFAKSMQAVDFVDYKKFSGLWYEIARTYNSYQEECVASSVEYKILKPYKYKVFNRCFKNEISGELISYEGYAEPKYKKNMSNISKTYFWFFTKDYKIVYLNKDYTTSVMSDEKMENIWIMHRKPFIDENELKKITTILKKYVKKEQLIFTLQDINGKYK